MDWQSLQIPAEDKWGALKQTVVNGWDKIKQTLNPKALSQGLGLTIPPNLPSPNATPEQKFKTGFENYGSPLATSSAKFAESAQKYNLPDPYLPATIALMETSGGKNQKFANNPFNWGMQDMPSLNHTIDRIYSGISGRFPYYQKYLQTKDLKDFFDAYTPQDGINPKTEDLIKRYNNLRRYFD